ncbi:MAG TPA: flagellar protein FlaG [Anaerolineae bacterium]|nr:flagellar protein FlaG [Anaerolineae bacterium]
MDINRIDSESLNIQGNPAIVSKIRSAEEEEDRVKTSGSGTSEHLDNQQVRELTEKLQGYVDRMNINIAFSTYGEKNSKTAVTVSEKETGRLIREIPPEELQQLQVKMEELAGMLFNGMV